MRLTDEVHLIGGGAFTGFGLSDDLDAHIYLLNGESSLAMVDCGMGTERGMKRVLENIRADDLDPNEIDWLLLTHYHTDHASGAGRYVDQLSLSVAFSAHEADALQTADHKRTSFEAAREAGFFPPDFDYPPCRVDRPLQDGDTFDVGTLRVVYLETPGHCAGHGSFLVYGRELTYLIAGDAVFAGGKLLLQAVPDCDLQASLSSVKRLAGLEFDCLLPGHGPIVLKNGKAHVEAAASHIDALAVPPNL